MQKEVRDAMDKKIVKIVCPACGEKIDAVAYDNKISGHCWKADRYVKLEVPEEKINV